MSSLVNEFSYYGLKGCFFLGKMIGIASYNSVAYIGGFKPMLYFPPSKEDILIEEIKNLKKELIEIKTNIKESLGKNQYQYQVVYINNNFLPIKEQDEYDLVCIEEIIDTENHLLTFPTNNNNINLPLIEEIN